MQRSHIVVASSSRNKHEALHMLAAASECSIRLDIGLHHADRPNVHMRSRQECNCVACDAHVLHARKVCVPRIAVRLSPRSSDFLGGELQQLAVLLVLQPMSDRMTNKLGGVAHDDGEACVAFRNLSRVASYNTLAFSRPSHPKLATSLRCSSPWRPSARSASESIWNSSWATR